MKPLPAIPRHAFDKLKAVRELTLRGVGGEKQNAIAIYRRKLATHGLTEACFDGALRAAAPEAVDAPEPIPSPPRTVYVSGTVVVKIIAGRTASLVRDGACGVVLRNGSLTLCGAGTITVTLTEPFRTLHASGSGAVSVSGFSFKEAGFYLSGSGDLTVSGEALRATLAPAGTGVLDAVAFAVAALKVTASVKSSLRATCRNACITAAGHASVQVTASLSATASATDSGAKILILGCPAPGRRPSASSLGRIRWQ